MSREQNARRYPRSKVQKPVLVAWKKGTEKHISRVENLALGGLFVCTKDSPAMGTSLQLLFNTPEGEVRVRAIVRIWWQDEAWAWLLFPWSRKTAHAWIDG